MNTITVSEEFHTRMNRYCVKHHLTVQEFLKKALDEQIKLRRFATKITILPQTVRVYT